LKNNQDLVDILFIYNQVNYSARVLKYSVTAIILPNKTVLITTTTKRFKKQEPQEDSNLKFNCDRLIFDSDGRLNPLKVLYRPGNWSRPIDIRFPIVFAESA
jgi:hypothetical protein